MLFLLSGSSGAGKTTLGRAVAERLEGLAFHELGEFADRPWAGEPGWAWRRVPLERALDRAREYQREGIDTLITEGVLGELLAAPSANTVDGIAPCLLDCSDEERLHRLRARDRRAYEPRQFWDFLAWALWLRQHAVDPQLFAGPIRGDGDTTWGGSGGKPGRPATRDGRLSYSIRRTYPSSVRPNNLGVGLKSGGERCVRDDCRLAANGGSATRRARTTASSGSCRRADERPLRARVRLGCTRPAPPLEAVRP